MDIRHVLQDCLLLLLFLPLHHGLSIDEDYEDAASFGRCPHIRNQLKNGRVRYRYKGRVAKFLCDSGFELAGKRSSTCVRGQWSNPLPVCVARGCNRVPTIANGRVTEMYRGALLVYDCNPGYTLAGDSSIHCDGRRWNATPPSCEVSIQDPETHCDFETYDLCGWTHDPIHDFDWRRNQFATPSGHVGTGPSFDHTFGKNKAGYYLYIEASSPRKINDVARLFSPVYHSEESGGCFIFWYHMYGTNTGGLRVYLKPESYVFNELSPKWQEIGDHGNEWLRGNISVPVFKENFQIVIEGVRGDGYMGDSAIDDVYLTKQDCESMENETDINSEDSSDSCRGRCRGPDSVETCGCNENCHAADNCCGDYMSLCFEANDTLVPDTDEALPGDLGKTTSYATVTAILPESTNGPTQALTTKLSSELPDQLSTTVSFKASSSAPSSSNFSDSTISVTSLSSTDGSVSSASTIITTKSSTPEGKPEKVFSSSITSFTFPNIPDTSLSTEQTKSSSVFTSSVGTTTSLKISPSIASSLKTSPSTTSLKTYPSTTSLKTSPTTTSLKTSPSTTSLNASPRTTTSIETSSVATTIVTQKSSVSTIQTSTQTMPANTTPNQTIFPAVTSTQNSKVINQTMIYITTESNTFSKPTVPDSSSSSTTTVIPITSTPRYNLRPRKSTTVLSTSSFSDNSLSTTSTFSSTETSKIKTSTVPITFSASTQARRWFTKLPVFTTRSFTTKPTEVATTKSSIIETTTVPSSFKTTKFRIPRPSILTFPSNPPTTADSLEIISSKGSDSSATVITVVIILLLCAVGGIIFYIRKCRSKRQSKLDDDSEMRFLPDSDYMEYSDASALDKIMVK